MTTKYMNTRSSLAPPRLEEPRSGLYVPGPLPRAERAAAGEEGEIKTLEREHLRDFLRQVEGLLFGVKTRFAGPQSCQQFGGRPGGRRRHFGHESDPQFESPKKVVQPR